MFCRGREPREFRRKNMNRALTGSAILATARGSATAASYEPFTFNHSRSSIHLYPDDFEQSRRTMELRDFAQRFPSSKRLRISDGIMYTTLSYRALAPLKSA